MHLNNQCEQKDLLRLYLQFFAEGSGDGGGAGTEASGGTEAAPAGESTEAATDTQQSTETKTYTPEEVAAVAKQAHLIPHNAVRERYKSTFANADKYTAMKEHLGAVAERYGVSLDDPEGLAKAIMNDTALVQAKAAELGVSEDVAKSVVEAEATNAINRTREAERVRREEFERMSREEEDLKKVYPSFDFGKASENPSFKLLVDNGHSMRDAYEMSHHAELTQAAINAAVERAKAEALAEYRSNAERPTEGAATHNTGNSPTNVSELHGAALDAFLESYPRKHR